MTDPREGMGAARYAVIGFVAAVAIFLLLAACAPAYKPLPPVEGKFVVLPIEDIKARKGPYAGAYANLATRTIYLPAGISDPHRIGCLFMHEAFHLAEGYWHPRESRNDRASYTSACAPTNGD